MTKSYTKKVKLAVKNKQTRWAPFWAVVRKYGAKKQVHPSQMTAHRRHWRRTKLRIKPRKTPKSHLG
ncbi:MAG TPA: 50S ribosomal protein L39e [Candidatus Nanoarchaeia archaeon]|nr:50S ribosomal protein L39e [Candidatus Nanoarchaeia archaeon]